MRTHEGLSWETQSRTYHAPVRRWSLTGRPPFAVECPLTAAVVLGDLLLAGVDLLQPRRHMADARDDLARAVAARLAEPATLRRGKITR